MKKVFKKEKSKINTKSVLENLKKKKIEKKFVPILNLFKILH